MGFCRPIVCLLAVGLMSSCAKTHKPTFSGIQEGGNPDLSEDPSAQPSSEQLQEASLVPYCVSSILKDPDYIPLAENQLGYSRHSQVGFRFVPLQGSVQSDGKTILSGYVQDGVNSHFFVARLDQGGSLDSSFAVGSSIPGTLIRDIGFPESEGGGMGPKYGDELVDNLGGGLAVDSADNLIVGGWVWSGTKMNFGILKVDREGVPDQSFGVEGQAITEISGKGDYLMSLALDSQSRIIAVGYSGGADSHFLVVRYLPSGVLDSSFGVGGKLDLNLSKGEFDGAKSVVVDSDGKLYVIGTLTKKNGSISFEILRLLENGDFDSSFAGGKVSTSWPKSQDSMPWAAAIDKSSRLVVGGRTEIGGVHRFALTRYLGDGSIDPVFGKIDTVVSPNADSHIRSLWIDSEDRVYAIGGVKLNGSWQSAIAGYERDGKLRSEFGELGIVVGGYSGKEEKILGGFVQEYQILSFGIQEEGIFTHATHLCDGELDSSYGAE